MNVRPIVRTSTKPRTWIPVALCVLALLGASPAIGGEMCSGEGPGLHAYGADDRESGTGGTGRAPGPRAIPLVSEDGDESGIGGTGARPTTGDDDESGVGGTGVLGPIQVLENERGGPRKRDGQRRETRVCVNGLEITVPAELAIESSSAGRALELANGRMAWIEAQSLDGRLVATRVMIAADRIGWSEVAERVSVGRPRGPRGRPGAVTQPTALPGGMYKDMGRWFVRSSGVGLHIDDETRVHREAVGRSNPTFRKGTWLRFQGIRIRGNEYYATRIELAPKGKIVIPERSLEEAVAERLRAKPNTRPEYVSIEGYVAGTTERPEIAGLPVELPGRASVAARDTVQPGRRARIGGRVTAEGALVVRPPPPALLPPRPEGPRGAGGPGATRPRSDAEGAGGTGPRSDAGAPDSRARPDNAREKPARVERPRERVVRPADVVKPPVRVAPDRLQVLKPARERAR